MMAVITLRTTNQLLQIIRKTPSFYMGTLSPNPWDLPLWPSRNSSGTDGSLAVRPITVSDHTTLRLRPRRALSSV